MLKPVHIDAVNLPDAWFQIIYHILDYGNKYIVDQGSFVGESRYEYDFLSCYIKHTYKEPWNTMLPDIPAHLNIPNPVENGYIEQYLPYIMTEHIEPEEEYTYGSRLTKQINPICELLYNTPNTNQAILQVAESDDYLLDDPPCLRSIKCKIKDNYLTFFPYFRSWDLWSGFPANLAAISVLQKYMADDIDCLVGPMLCYSDGAHIYGYVEELVKIRTMKE